MATREILLERPDVPNDDIDDIIEIASELQDAARASQGASVAEVEAVAEELQIDPAYVEQAIGTLQQRRAEGVQATQEQSVLRRRVLWVGAGAAGVLLVLLLLVSAVGSASLSSATAEVAAAEANLNVVLERQASLAPQLVAMSGGDASGLSALSTAVTSGDPAARLAASDTLATEMAKRLGALPAATTEAGATARLNLQHELTGSANRITVERRRYEQARVAYEQVASGAAPTVARSVGCGD